MYTLSVIFWKQQQYEVSPLEIAIETMETTNEMLKSLINQHRSDSSLRIDPLSMKLNGMVDPAVNGGIFNYKVGQRSSKVILTVTEKSNYFGDIVPTKVFFRKIFGGEILNWMLKATLLQMLRELMLYRWFTLKYVIDPENRFWKCCPFKAVFLTLPMLRLLLSKARGCKGFWKPSKPCHVSIPGIVLAESSQMTTHVPGFQSFQWNYSCHNKYKFCGLFFKGVLEKEVTCVWSGRPSLVTETARVEQHEIFPVTMNINFEILFPRVS